MKKLSEITQVIEAWAPVRNAESFDNVGLLIGDKNQEITNVLVTLDCTEQVIDEAINNGINLIVTFHPIIFSGLKKITGNTYVERVVQKAIKHDIAIYALHTNLDFCATGSNHYIASKLKLEKIKGLVPKEKGSDLFIGVTGYLNQPLDEADFLDMVKALLPTNCIRHSELMGKPIKKVGLIGGAGSFGLKSAKLKGCDAYISADFKYHDFFQAEGQLLIVDTGHYEMEQFNIELIANHLQDNISDINIAQTSINTNPVHYF